jgi:spore coat polysaccharide biosynthesis protein SpsF
MMLGESPLIDHVYDRLGAARYVTGIVIATSTDESDDPLASHCRQQGMPCHRGSLPDVASRFLDIVRARHEPAFLRISGDSPLIDPALVDRAIDEFGSSELDLLTNVQVRSFPKGQSVEVLSSATFKKAYPDFSADHHYEHVTTYFYENAGSFKIRNIVAPGDYGEINLSVDTAEDMKRIGVLVKQSGTQGNWREYVDGYKELFAHA